MRARIARMRVVSTSLVVLFWLSASGGRAEDALVGEFGPIRQSVAHSAVRGAMRIDMRSNSGPEVSEW